MPGAACGMRLLCCAPHVQQGGNCMVECGVSARDVQDRRLEVGMRRVGRYSSRGSQRPGGGVCGVRTRCRLAWGGGCSVFLLSSRRLHRAGSAAFQKLA